MRKILLLLLLLLSASLPARRKTVVMPAFDPRSFEVEVAYMDPLRWSPRSVSYGYSLAVNNDSVTVHLPYMGVAYQTDMDNDGLNFERPIESFFMGKGKKGRILLSFSCRKGFISYLFRLTIYPNGKADIHLSPSNADAVGYEGEWNAQ